MADLKEVFQKYGGDYERAADLVELLKEVR